MSRPMTAGERLNLARACREHIYAALGRAMAGRYAVRTFEWVDQERTAVAIAATEWATAHGIDVQVTVADVERIEATAVGHVDYQSKLALYVTEFVFSHAWTPPSNHSQGRAVDMNAPTWPAET